MPKYAMKKIQNNLSKYQEMNIYYFDNNYFFV